MTGTENVGMVGMLVGSLLVGGLLLWLHCKAIHQGVNVAMCLQFAKLLRNTCEVNMTSLICGIMWIYVIKFPSTHNCYY